MLLNIVVHPPGHMFSPFLCEYKCHRYIKKCLLIQHCYYILVQNILTLILTLESNFLAPEP